MLKAQGTHSNRNFAKTVLVFLKFMGSSPRVNRGNHVHYRLRSSGTLSSMYRRWPFFLVCIISINCNTRMFHEAFVEMFFYASEMFINCSTRMFYEDLTKSFVFCHIYEGPLIVIDCSTRMFLLSVRLLY
jgi:hypothetical protein